MTGASFQKAFAEALNDWASPVPKGLAAWNGPAPERRFQVYRNNVLAGLTGALASRFPVGETIVGEDFFRAMAQAYIAAHPPRSPLLLAYGDDFPDFVAGFGPAAELAYLPDVLRIEVARGRAYHAADAVPLAPDHLATLAPDTLADLRVNAHPATSVIRSSHPIVTIWSMNSGAIPMAPLDDWRAEDALIVRPHMLVQVYSLPPGGAAFIGALMEGATLSGAAEAGAESDAAFDLTTNLAGMIQTGAFTTLI